MEKTIKLYNLPSLNELFAELGKFELEESEDFVETIIKKLSDKVDNYIKFLEDILQPDQTIVCMQESGMFDNKSRKELFHILKILIYQNRLFLKIDLNGTEEEKANYFKEFFSKWQEVKIKLAPIVDKALSVWKKSDEETNLEAYFG